MAAGVTEGIHKWLLCLVLISWQRNWFESGDSCQQETTLKNKNTNLVWVKSPVF